MGPAFFQTVMGRAFFEGHVPVLITTLREIRDAVRANAEATNRLAAAVEAATPKKGDA